MLVPQRFQRGLPIVVIIIVFLFLITAIRFRNGSFSVSYGPLQPQPQVPPEAAAPKEPIRLPVSPGQCLPEIDFLRRKELDLTDEITYSRRCIKPLWSVDANRANVTKVDRQLTTQLIKINLATCEHAELPPCDELPLHVPYPHPRAKYPHLLFVISTIYDRVGASLPQFAHWMAGSGAKLVAVVVDAEKDGEPAKDLRALEELYRTHDIDLHAVVPRIKDLSVDQNHFVMIADVLDAVTNETRWLGVLDDDTFFPSLYNLDEELKKHDDKGSTWLGALSEDFESVKTWGFMAFGGAGVFISVPLARELVPHIPACLKDARQGTGDCILRDCIYDHTHTKLTLVPGLYQHDLHHDASGFYESGVQPLSLHHWKSWYNEPVDKMAAAASFCGDCFLQRWQFGNDVLLANGYSITQYPRGLDQYDLTLMEGSWGGAGLANDFSLGPLRNRLEREE